MHKGYTLNYFINLFTNTTNSQWSTGDLPAVTYTESGTRIAALTNFVGSNRTLLNISRGNGRYASLGVTPRARLLRALRNRKRTGNVWGSNS